MAYQTLYRVYRPSAFDEVIGQRHITDILKKQMEKGQPSHAYLFYGPRGTGKTSTARIFANALNCLDPQNGDPCHVCDVCVSFEKDAFVDIVEIDAASNNGVDNVRDIREKVSLLPAQGKYKVYIIDEVHMLSAGAFNALLKTLEEPPPHAIFILATTEIRKVPATIRSRCQTYDFKRITDKDIVARLEYVAAQKGIEYEPEALELIARQAEGAMRDALSIMDQCIAGHDKLTVQAVVGAVGIADMQEVQALAHAILDENAGQALQTTNGLLQNGVSAHNLLRDLIVALSGELAANVRDPYQCANTLRSLEALISVQNTLRYSGVPNAVLTAAVVRAATNTTDVDTEDMELRLKKLENRVERMAQHAAKAAGAQPVQNETVQKAVVEPVRQVEIAEEAAPEETSAPLKDAAEAIEPWPPAGKPEAKTVAPSDGGGQQNGSLPREKLHLFQKGVLARNKMLKPAVDAVKAMELKGGRLILHVAAGDAPVAEMLAEDVYGSDVTPVLEEVLGRAMKIGVVPIGVREEQPETDMAQQLMDIFGEDNVVIKE